VKPESDFWRAVRELAAMREHIPDERRRGGNVYQWLREKVKP